MARLQILELPEGAGDDQPPFVLVIDQYEPPPYPDEPGDTSPFDGVAEKIGARGVLVFEETIDIPANQVTVDDGQAIRLKVDPDLGDCSEKIETAIADANKRLVEQLRAVSRQEAVDG
ncbi:hypothetical protein [Streptomyces sparsogenes]|uniref:Uncharacterized protein n=1 Tax=Streptomyces sparsogenes DSM 40356 TaxID=1331668 RepID=A0A1R1S7T9_9ACTN|nr:hypothetical protein [Streptomyces sparsogenes]OMI34386.1 hypothetical protein SPAR_36421 [Streptomyces sparsogenes DSM 40356]